MQRANTEVMDGHYTFPGGHVESDERLEQAVVRETFEEVGIEVQSVEPVCLLPYAQGLNLIFESERWHGEALNREPDKCTHVGWHPISELPQPLVPWLERALALSGSSDWYCDLSD